MTAAERWKPNVTVAAVIEHDGRFLLVEEHTGDGLKLNTPAGHLDPGESPAEGCARETLEETAHHFVPTALVGIYMARSTRETNGVDVTYLRFAFAGTLGAFEADRTLDNGIVRTLWMTADELRGNRDRHRSPLLMQCIDDYLTGRRFPLDLVHVDASIAGLKNHQPFEIYRQPIGVSPEPGTTWRRTRAFTMEPSKSDLFGDDMTAATTPGKTPWTTSYPPGMRWDAELALKPIAQFLSDAAARWPDNSCIEFMGRVISYRELDELSNRAAQGFQALGVKPGVHVGLFLPNTPHYPIAFFGVLKAGGVVVNYSPLDVERVLAHKVEDSQTDIQVTLDLAVLYPQMARILASSRLKKLVVGSLAEYSGAPDKVNAMLQGAGQLATVPADDKHMSFAQLLDNDGAGVSRHPLGDLTKEVVVLQYTGGTTGLPKGAMLTHANLGAASAQYLESTKGDPPILADGVERFLIVLPLFHIYALSAAMLLGMRLGAALVLHTKFDIDAVLREIAVGKITVFPGVPTMYTAMLSHPKAKDTDMTSLKFCGSGGAPLPVEVEQRFFEMTGCHLNEGWGMTETSPSGTFTPARGARKAGSCGMPLPGIDIKLLALDGSGREAATGEPGELCVKGPNVMLGYWNNPGATAESMTPDGYFRSGDVARFDPDGFLYIVDRTKDMLLCGGFNVYPRVLEEAIYEHPCVAEVCVIGVPDEYRGQSPKAFVVLKAGAALLELDVLKTFLKDRLGKHEMIGFLEVRKELPKTAVGKLSKKDLVEEEARKRATP